MPDDTPSGAQGWFINTRREKFQDRKAARGAELRLRLRMDQQVHHVRLIPAHPFGVSELRHDGERQARAPRNWLCSSRSAARYPTRCSASRSCRRYPTARARIARCCGAPRSSCRRRAMHQGRQARLGEGRALGDRIPDRRAVISGAPHAVHQEPGDARHRRQAPHRRSGADAARLKDFDFDLTIQRFGFSATPGDSLRNYFSSQAAAMKGSQNLAGIADPAIDALIDGSSPPRSRAELSPPAGRSIA